METRRTGSVGEVNSKESMLLHWNSQRYYGYRLSDVPTSSSELLFVCSKFIVSCDLNYNHGYVSMASISNTSDQLRAALCLELMLKRRVFVFFPVHFTIFDSDKMTQIYHSYKIM